MYSAKIAKHGKVFMMVLQYYKILVLVLAILFQTVLVFVLNNTLTLTTVSMLDIFTIPRVGTT